MRRLTWCTLIILALGAAAARAQTPAPQPAGEAQKPGGGIRLVWDDRPSVRIGEHIRIDARVKLQTDIRVSEWEGLEDEGGLFDFNRKRLGVEGEITRYVEFEVEAELRENNPLRDAFVNVKPADVLEVQGGKFKMPFSYEQLTGPTALDFVKRSMLANTIAPARDIGVMAHGRLIGRVLTYEIGAFKNDGENASLDEGFLLPGEAWHNEHGAAARVTVQPFRRLKGAGAFERLQVGAAYTTSHVPEGLNSLKGETPLGFVFFEPVYTYGRRWRIGLETVWMPGPFSIKSEYARSDEDRVRQGLGDVDLSDFIASGWYVSGTWAITGESKEDGIEPRRPIFQGGLGALELALRYEELGFGSELTGGEAYSNPRADPVLPNRDHLWTVGLTWYLNKWSKVQLNGIRETFQDPERSPIPGQPVWSGVCRLQFVM